MVSAIAVALCQCNRFCGSCTWQSALLQNVWLTWPTFEQGQTCTRSSGADYLSGGLCLYERLCVRNLLGAFKKKKSLYCCISNEIRRGLFPFGVDAPGCLFVLHNSFPPQGLCQLLMSHWKLLAFLCLSAPADQFCDNMDIFWVSLVALPPRVEWSSTRACCCPVCIALHTWLLVVLLWHFCALFCGEGPKPPFWNARICCQLLRAGRSVPLSVKNQSSGCASDRAMVFWNPATLKLWRFSFRVKAFKLFSYKIICRFTGAGSRAGSSEHPVKTGCNWVSSRFVVLLFKTTGHRLWWTSTSY